MSDLTEEQQAILKTMTASNIGESFMAFIIQEIKALPDVWQKLNQNKQGDVIDRARLATKEMVSRAIHLLASENRPVIDGVIKQAMIKDGKEEPCVYYEGDLEDYNKDTYTILYKEVVIAWMPIQQLAIKDNIDKNILLLSKGKTLFIAPLSAKNYRDKKTIIAKNIIDGTFYSFSPLDHFTHFAVIELPKELDNANPN